MYQWPEHSRDMEDSLGEVESMEGLEPAMIRMTTLGAFAKNDLSSTHDVFTSNAGLRADRGSRGGSKVPDSRIEGCPQTREQ
jgi:hypothetical protein